MNVKDISKKIEAVPSKQEIEFLKKETNNFVKTIKGNLKSKKLGAEVFIGGSFAKGTLAKSNNYDIDIFIRFEKNKKNISEELERIIAAVSAKIKIPFSKLHGSRDYFRIEKNEKLTFEIIPVLKIKKVNEAENVTDLSYFHVNFIKKSLNAEMKKEVALAKNFFKAQKVYGAESYIGGFSGYALECLIKEYKTLVKMLKVLIKIKENEKLIIDSKRFYKNKNEVLINLNESRTQSPVILIDPTWKERNVLAALAFETLEKLQKAARAFLKNPSEKYFILTDINSKKLKQVAKKKNAEFVHIEIKTNRQEGDIAGTKMKKFSKYLESELKKFFEILESEFEYAGGKIASVYFIVRPKKEFLKLGPRISDKKNAHRFKERNKDIFEKDKRLYARIFVNFEARDFLKSFAKNEKQKINEMAIIEMKIRN